MRFFNIEKIYFFVGMIWGAALLDPVSYGQSFLFQGASSSFESGFSQTNTRGAVGAASNPANIVITRKREAYFDLSLLNVSYVYARENYDSAKVEKTAPPVNFGFSFRPRSNFALGILVTPRPGLSADKISSVPQSIGGEPVEVDIEQKSSTYLTAIGAAIKLNKITSIGLSVIETAEDNQIIVRQAGTTDDANAIFGMRNVGSSMQFVLGIRAMLDAKGTIGASFKTATAKKYKGTKIVKGDEDSNTSKKGYSPSVIAFGGEYRLGLPSVFGELRYELWSRGRELASSGTPGSAPATAFNDVTILIAGGRLRFPGSQSASASIGIYPSNVGQGSTTEQLKAGGGMNGVQFGEFDALDRMMFSVSYRLTRKKSDITAGFNFITGSKQVPSEYPGSGKYSLTVLTLGAGGSLYF